MYSSYSLKFASVLKTKIDEYSEKNHINLEKSLPMGGGGVVTPKHLDPPPPMSNKAFLNKFIRFRQYTDILGSWNTHVFSLLLFTNICSQYYLLFDTIRQIVAVIFSAYLTFLDTPWLIMCYSLTKIDKYRHMISGTRFKKSNLFVMPCALCGFEASVPLLCVT